MGPIKEMNRHVDVVLRALDILDTFHSKPVLTLKEIIEATGINRSRVLRLTGTMESRGYLIYDGEQRRFRLGPRLLTLGKVFEDNNTLIAVARPILKDLVRLTGELASLYVMDGLERVALVREKGSHPISYTVSEGQRMALYAGAAGKVLLAFAPLEIQKKICSRGFMKRLTPNTIIDPKRLFRELEKIRDAGFATSEGERAVDVWSVAAPVLDFSGAICCAIGITGPVYRFPMQTQLKLQEAVISKAHELSARLGNYQSQHTKKEDAS